VLHHSPPIFPSFSPIPPPPRSTLFPYTTLFRSHFWQAEYWRTFSLAGGHRRNTWQSVARQLMPDWQELLRQRLSGLALAAKERRSEEHTSELQSRGHLVCRLLLEKKKQKKKPHK